MVKLVGLMEAMVFRSFWGVLAFLNADLMNR